MTDIQKVTAQFKSKTLSKEQWTHKAHIAVAFDKIDKYKNIEKALHCLQQSIKEYNISVGIDNTENSGYHETLTVFWLNIVYEYYLSTKHLDIDEIYKGFTKMLLPSTNFHVKFYSKELLFSKSARQIWTKPDLLPLPKIKEIISKSLDENFILKNQKLEG